MRMHVQECFVNTPHVIKLGILLKPGPRDTCVVAIVIVLPLLRLPLTVIENLLLEIFRLPRLNLGTLKAFPCREACFPGNLRFVFT